MTDELEWKRQEAADTLSSFSHTGCGQLRRTIVRIGGLQTDT